MISVQNLTKTYSLGGRRVVGLKNAQTEIAAGEFVCVVGPSGSGKSTFLLSLGGLITPSAGRVVINGQSIYELTSSTRARFRRTEIGFIFQTFNVIPYLTALENVEMPLLLDGMGARDQRKIATKLLEQFGLGDRLTHRPAELSVGERQRVCLARALANDPPVILADEPTGNLDPERSLEILSTLRTLARQGRTVVVVTHDHAAASVADRRLDIVDGCLSEFGVHPEHANATALA